MLHQPLLFDRPFAAQLVIAVVPPVAFGILTGYILGVDQTGYLVLSVVGIAGGIAAGFDHLGSDEGFVRGIAGGLLFGIAILVAHSVFGQEATAKLPHPHVVLPIITTILGGILGAIGGALRARSEAKRARATPAA